MTWVRKLAYRVSMPCQNGELALRASIGGSHTRIRSSMPTASSSESTDTWTWHPQVSCSLVVSPNRSAIRSKRASRTRRGSTGMGDVPTATTRAPASRASAIAVSRHARTSASRSAMCRCGGVSVSICCCCSSWPSDPPELSGGPVVCDPPRSRIRAETERGRPVFASTSSSSSSIPTVLIWRKYPANRAYMRQRRRLVPAVRCFRTELKRNHLHTVADDALGHAIKPWRSHRASGRPVHRGRHGRRSARTPCTA